MRALWVVVLLIGFASLAAAQEVEAPAVPEPTAEQPQRISLSGALMARGAVRRRLFPDGVGGALPGGTDAGVSPLLRLRADMALSDPDGWSGRVQLANRRFPEAAAFGSDLDDAAGVGSASRAGEPLLEALWSQLRFENGWLLRAGLQDLHYRLREDGEAWLLDLLEARSPFDGRPISTGGGVRTTYKTDIFDQDIHIDSWYLRALKDGLRDDGEALWGANLDLLLGGPRRGLRNLIHLTLLGANRDGEHLITAGGGLDWHLSDDWEVFAEAYGQVGRLGEDERAAHRGLAFRAGVRRTWFRLRSEPFIELSYGHRAGGSGSIGFRSYGNLDTFRLLEDDELGLGQQSNVASIRLRAGLDLSPAFEAKPGTVGLELRAGSFRTPQRVSERSRRLGHELDLLLRWRPSESVELGVGGALLLDAQHFADGPGDSSRASLLWLEAVFRF